MKSPAHVVLAVLVAYLVCTSPAATAGPYRDGKFQGRIGYSADGNHNDQDDWASSPIALAILAECGLKDALAHFDYNCILPKTDPEWEKSHAASVLGAAERYGYRKSLFHDCRHDLDAAVASITRAVDASSADDPFYFIIAGPVEVPYLGMQKANPEKRRFVYCISHSRWNDGYSSNYTFTHTKRSLIDLGVNWIQIADQNPLLSMSPYGKAAPPDSWKPYHWLRDSGDTRLDFLWQRLQLSARPDASDAGMAYFLATGDEETSTEKLRSLLAEHKPPDPTRLLRRSIRLEAENFRQLKGFEVEDSNDRSTSHGLHVRLNAERGRISTPFHELYAPVDAEYNLEIRCFDEAEVGGRLVLVLTLDGRPEALARIELPGKGGGWKSYVISRPKLREGDVITVAAEDGPVRLDYVQLNAVIKPVGKD